MDATPNNGPPSDVPSTPRRRPPLASHSGQEPDAAASPSRQIARREAAPLPDVVPFVSPDPERFRDKLAHIEVVVGIAQLPKGASEREIRDDITESLSQYGPNEAIHARTEFVSHRSTFRKANKVVFEELSMEQRRRVELQASRERRTTRSQNMERYFTELDKLCGGRHIWQGAARLPATPEASSDLIKIVRYISNLGRDPRTLWQEGGELFGVDFTRRKLDIVWKDIRARGNRQRGVVGLRREPAGADESSEEPEAPRNQRDHSEAVPVSDDGHDQELRVEAARSDPAEVGDDHPLPLQEDALDHIFNSSPPPSRGRSPIQDPEINRSHSPVPELVLGSDPPESPISQPPAAKRLRGNVDAPVPLPLGLPHGVHAECLEPGQRLSGTTILYILQQIVALCPLSFRVVDPLLLKGEPLPSRAVSELIELPKFRAIIAPVHVFDSGAQHWALAVVSPDSVRIFDSFPPASADVELRAKLCGLLTTLNVDENIEFLRQPCPRQINDSDCGVAVIVNAIHIIARVPVPAVDECDYGIWRRVFIALITRGSLQLDCPGVPILTADVLPPRLCTLPPQFTIAEYRAWQQEQAKTVESQFEELLVPRRRIAESLENVIEVLDALLASTSESGRRFPGISFTELDLQINICTTGLMADADNYGVASPEFEKRSTRLHRLRGLEARRQDALDRIMELYEKIEGGLHDLGRE